MNPRNYIILCSNPVSQLNFTLRHSQFSSTIPNFKTTMQSSSTFNLCWPHLSTVSNGTFKVFLEALLKSATSLGVISDLIKSVVLTFSNTETFLEPFARLMADF